MVEDALFCHRCGKAQRELLAADPVYEEPAAAVNVEPAAPPPPLAALAGLPVTFRNTVAVRIGFLVASVASLLDFVPGLNWLFVIWSVCAGFLAVFLYRRTTGQSLTMRNGARLGWIAGVMNSLIVIVLFTISIVASAGEITSALRDQIRSMAPNDSNALALVDSPYALVTIILMTLVMLFLIFTCASIAGGVLGARITREDHAPNRKIT